MAIERSEHRLAKEARIAAIRAGDRRMEGVAADDLVRLERDLWGWVVLPGDPGYEKDSEQSNPLFHKRPAAIAYCGDVADVRTCVIWARVLGLSVSCRSGGHSTAGYAVMDGELCIDMSRMTAIAIDHEARIGRVQPGVTFGELNSVLDRHRLHVPGGGCEDVCVAGYMQGGGFGFTSRRFGMNCDNVVEIAVMDRDGVVHRADARSNADLFWAVRGGTGGNFGIVVEIAYRLHPLGNVWGFGVRWDIEHAAGGLEAMQRGYTRGGATDRIGYMSFIIGTKGPLALYMRGIFVGSAEEGRQALAPILATPGASLEMEKTALYGVLNDWLLADLAPKDLSTAYELKVSNYVDRPLSLEEWQRAVTLFRDMPGYPTAVANTLTIEPYGGAIARRDPSTDNAFVHRDVDLDFVIDSFWSTPEERPQAVAWLESFSRFLRDGPMPAGNGRVYQNYPENGLETWRRAYFADAFPRLLEIKARHDPPDPPQYPDGFYHFPQSIRPPDGDPWPGAKP